jgi:hypothetical protein
MLSLLLVLGLDSALLEELARRGPVVTVEAKAPAGLPKGFSDPALRPGITVLGGQAERPAASADKPDCPIRIGGGDRPLSAAVRLHDVKPPVDAFMAVPGRCNPKAIR